MKLSLEIWNWGWYSLNIVSQKVAIQTLSRLNGHSEAKFLTFNRRGFQVMKEKTRFESPFRLQEFIELFWRKPWEGMPKDPLFLLFHRSPLMNEVLLNWWRVRLDVTFLTSFSFSFQMNIYVFNWNQSLYVLSFKLKLFAINY